MKEKSEPKKKEVPEKPKAPQQPVPTPPSQDEEKPFDFGGLPDRDLKKNLGCG